MASTNWGKVYFKNKFAGLLEEEPGGRCSFIYDDSFLETSKEALSVNLALDKKIHMNENGLAPFFDNLVAEGWLAEIQAKAAGTRTNDRFKLLIAFGEDCIGAVTVIDPKPDYEISLDHKELLRTAAIKNKASMSGVQPKLLVYKKAGKFYPSDSNHQATHIAKLPGSYPNILENEYLTTKAYQELFPSDSVVELELGEVEEGVGKALIIKRFDRTAQGEKLHFEEFSQLLNMKASAKYDADYSELADFMNESPLCSKIDVEKIFRRILACILLGNTDAHVKNFAMFHRTSGLDLTPVYDMVFSAYYDLNDLALGFGDINPMSLKIIKAKHLKKLCQDFKLPIKVLELAVEEMGSRLEKIYNLIDSHSELNCDLRKALKEQVKKRWNGSFKTILG